MRAADPGRAGRGHARDPRRRRRGGVRRALRWQDPERLFDLLAAEGARLAEARAAGGRPDPAPVNRTFPKLTGCDLAPLRRRRRTASRPRRWPSSRRGRKQSHWMWFVFPQIAGLGRSPMARPLCDRLGATRRAPISPIRCSAPRLRECIGGDARPSRARAPRRSSAAIDAIKFRSSMTLFEAVADDAGARSPRRSTPFTTASATRATLELLGAMSEGEAARKLAGAARGRVRAALYARAQGLPARREGGRQAHLPQGRRMVPRARPDPARPGPRRHPRPGPLSRRRARRTACASASGPARRSRRASSTSTRSCRAISASRRRGTASSNIGRSRACCCSTAC